MRPDIVGSEAMTSRFTDVAAPVRAELNTVSDCAVTVTITSTLIGFTSKTRSEATPRLTSTFSCVVGSKAAPAPPMRDGDRIRSANPHTGNQEASIAAACRFIGGPGRQMDRDDLRTRHGLLLRICHHAGNHARCHALCC